MPFLVRAVAIYTPGDNDETFKILEAAPSLAKILETWQIPERSYMLTTTDDDDPSLIFT